jgi:hypothetical protein
MDELELRYNSSMPPAGSDILPDAVIQSSAPDDGRKHSPKHVELIRNNILTYIVASRWLYSQLHHDARIHEVT